MNQSIKLGVILVLLALLVACGEQPAVEEAAPAEEAVPAAESESAEDVVEEEAVATECDEGFRPYEHFGGVTCIPDNPQRVVTLQDQLGLLPLWELGFRGFAGSVGAFDGNGEPYFRRMAEQGFDPVDVEFIGNYSKPNLEGIATVNPDLIVAFEWQVDMYDLLSEIAPTVLMVDPSTVTLQEGMLNFGRLVGLEGEVERLEAEYQQALADLREAAGDPSEIVISKIETAAGGGAEVGQFYINARGATERILREVGFARPAPQLAVENDRVYYSVELLPEHDADLLMRIVTRQGADEEVENTQAILGSPLWEQLNATQKGQAVDVNGEMTYGFAYSPSVNYINTLIDLLEDLDTSGDLSTVEIATPTSAPTEESADETTSSADPATEADEAVADATFADTYQVPGFPPFAPAPTMFEVVEDKGDTIVVRHRFGETEIPANPQRVYSDASLLPTALTLDLNIVGAQHYPDMPDLPNWEADIEGVQVTPIVSYDFNFEEVAALDPDLIIGYGNFFWTDQDGETVYERASRIAPTIVPIDDPVAFYEQAARNLATSLGSEPGTVETQISTLNAEIAEACRPLQETVGDETVALIIIWGDQPSLQGVVWNSDGKFVNVADSYWLYGLCRMTPPDSLPELVGNEFALDLSYELLPDIQADHIFVSTQGDATAALQELTESPIWQALPAVQNDQAYIIQYFSSYSYDTALAAIAEAHKGITAATE